MTPMDPNQVFFHMALIVFFAGAYALVKGLIAERRRKKRYAAGMKRLAERDLQETREWLERESGSGK